MITQNEHTLILIVDDNPTNCELLHRRLTRQGYNCSIANSGRQMLDMVRETKPNLVLLDLMMPEMDGIEALRILRESQNSVDLPVLIVTAKNAREDVVTAFEFGANDYIEKPIDFPILLARMKNQLEHKRLRDETKKNKSQLKERNAQWQKAHQQKILLLAALSEELASPTAEILVDTDNMIASTPETPGQQAPLERIRQRAKQLNQLAHDLKEFARMEAGNLELVFHPADFYVLLTSVISEFSPKAKKQGVNLNIQIDEDLGVVTCDPNRTRQIFSNLLGNALHVTMPGDRIEFSAGLTSSSSIKVCIRDMGPRLNLEDQESVFLPFNPSSRTSASNLADTTGLELALTGKLVALHHGFIEVENMEDQGNRFTVYLPYNPIEDLV